MPAENYEPHDGRAVYRFFELFDLPNIPGIENTLRANAEGRITITPPIKPYLEEKMWFALFWLQPLREFWRRELGDKYFIKLQEMIPYSWLLDPTPLPSMQSFHVWKFMTGAKLRSLVRKIATSFESERFFPAWLGQPGYRARDRSSACGLGKANQPRIGNIRIVTNDYAALSQRQPVRAQYWDPGSGEVKIMKGRVRLCPYYFVEPDRVKFRGALATIAPADKKFLHGMSDAILVPSKAQ